MPVFRPSSISSYAPSPGNHDKREPFWVYFSNHAYLPITGEAFYEEFLSCLEPVDVANAVLYALEQPPHVNISQVVIEPTRVGKKT